jgi:1-acyl-sn-glycerol-3-phosphate acyltransferase
LGLLSCVSASRASLKQTLQLQSVRLYVGGTTEIFECTPHVEVLHLTKHKGFIKLALQLGVDVVPVYMFGNTSVFFVWNDKYGILVRLSRMLQLPVTYCQGAYGLPIPHNDKVREEMLFYYGESGVGYRSFSTCVCVCVSCGLKLLLILLPFYCLL